ncbi:MAG: zinc-dependent metalloprotease [Actinomycetota bacterium]
MSENPFGDMFNDLFAMMSKAGPDAWYSNAQQMALSVARGDDGDPNPAPAERQKLEELAPLIARHIEGIFAVQVEPHIECVTRTQLTQAALDQWKPLLEPGLAISSQALSNSDMPQIAALASTLGPLMIGFQMGSIAGHFSEQAWSLATLPLPRIDGVRRIAVNNVVRFVDEWSLDHQAVFTFALAQEMVASLVLSREGTSDALRALLVDTVRESAALQGGLIHRIQEMMQEGSPQELMANPEQMFEGMDAPEATPATDALNAAAGVLSAFIAFTALRITEMMFGPSNTLAEAYRRHCLSDAQGEAAASALFGIAPRSHFHEPSNDFVATIAEKHGIATFDALLRVDGLPLASELNDPEVWFERVTNSPLA